MNFYNEIDKYAAQWLRNLIAAGHIAPGVVDERSIVDIDPDELRPFTQCHFFAGIGVWSHALRLAGWPNDRPVWTGSCPCQPFSAAGKRGGHEDERHLWPAWQRLIRECKPAVVYGEQVASPDGLAWLDVVLSDLEDDHYAVAAANLCAAGVGAPHIRQRIYFVAHAERGAAERHGWTLGAAARGSEGEGHQRERLRPEPRDGGIAGLVAHANAAGQREQRCGGLLDGERQAQRNDADGRGAVCIVADAHGRNASAEGLQRSGQHGLEPQDGSAGRPLGDADDARLEGRQPESERAGERAVGAAGLAGELADADFSARGQGSAHAPGRDEGTGPQGAGLGSADDRGRSVADAELHDGTGRLAQPHGRPPVESDRHGAARGKGDADSEREDALGGILGGPHAERARSSFWSDADWIPCRDGKARPVEPGTFPLVDGSVFRVGSGSPLEGKSRDGMLRAYGNAIVAPVAATFIEACMDVMP